MDRMDFTQGVVRTRILEKRLLTKEKFDRMIAAKDISEVFRLLKETEYANALSNFDHEYDFEKVLSHELVRVYDLMREISIEPAIVHLMALKYDYHNLKVLLKEILADVDLNYLYLPVGNFDIRKIKSSIIEHNLNDIEPIYRDAIESVLKEFRVTRDPQKIGLITDRFYMSHLYKVAVDTGVQLMIDYVKAMIDFINIRSAMRIRKQGRNIRLLEEILIPNGNIDRDSILFTLNEPIQSIIHKFRHEKVSMGVATGLDAFANTDHLTEYEKVMDDYLMGLCKTAKYVNFGPEPLFSYVIAKEMEIKNLRIIMVSKLNGISPEKTRERMREIYV